MKKTLILTLFLCVSFLVMDICYAASNEISIETYNLLNLRTIEQKPENPIFGYCDYPFITKDNQQFTLVMSYAYVNTYFTEVMDSDFEYEIFETGQPFTYRYIADEINHLIYVEFTPLADFTLFNVPVTLDSTNPNYEIVMYIGTYQNFKGFEPYLNEDYKRSESGTIDINYDHLLSTDDLLSLITAYDNNHNAITYDVIKDTYSDGNKLPGSYEIKLLATLNHIKKYYMLSIVVKDTTPPEIIGPKEITLTYGDKKLLTEIMMQYIVSDNVDQLTYENIEIVRDEYSSSSTIGAFVVEMKISDSSGNETSNQVTINVLDQVPPKIKGPDAMMVYTTDDPLDSLEILSAYSAYDDVDGSVSVTVTSDNYHQDVNEGVYEMVLKSTDAHQNEALKTIYIHVIENRGPSFEVETPIIETSTTKMMTQNDVLRYMQNYLYKQNSNIENIDIVYNEYENHESEAGSYYIYFNYDLNGETYTSRVNVEVVDNFDLIDYWYYGFVIIPIGAFIMIRVLKNKKKI